MRRHGREMFERFYQAGEAKGLAFGTHCWSADPGFYEMCGHLGYDYIWIDNEHGGMTFPMIYTGIVAANASGAAAIVRVPGHGMEDVKPVLEMGPQGIVFPLVNTAKDAEICAKHCMYPPDGTRGFGPLRAIDYNEKPLGQYLEEIGKKTLCLVQCESVEAVRNLDEIMAVPGVDGIICGPMDLSGSAGKLGQLEDPEILEYMNTVICKCKAAGKAFGVSLGDKWKLARYWMEQGANLVSVGNAYDYFSRRSHEVLKEVEEFRCEEK